MQDLIEVCKLFVRPSRVEVGDKLRPCIQARVLRRVHEDMLSLLPQEAVQLAVELLRKGPYIGDLKTVGATFEDAPIALLTLRLSPLQVLPREREFLSGPGFD